MRILKKCNKLCWKNLNNTITNYKQKNNNKNKHCP